MFTLSIFFSCLVVFVLLLDLLFYDSKSCKLNRLASLFKKKNRRVLVRILTTLSELFTLLLSWPDLVLIKAFVKTPHCSKTLMRSLLNKLQDPQLIEVALALLFLLPFRLIALFFASHFIRELFTELAEKTQKATTNSSDFCTSTIYIFCTSLLTPYLSSFFY